MSNKTYLFLLKEENLKSCNEAIRIAKKLKITILAQYGGIAIVVRTNQKRAEKLFKTGIFSTRSTSSLTSIPDDALTIQQRQIVDIWNAQFDAGYVKSKKESNRKKSAPWGDTQCKEPAPPMPIDIEDFKKKLLEITKNKKGNNDSNLDIDPDPKKWEPTNFKKLTKFYEERFKDSKLAYTAALTFYHLNDLKYRLYLLDSKFLDIIHDLLVSMRPEDGCWKMHGRNSIGIVFVESSQAGGPRFTGNQRNQICNEIINGMSWLSDEHPSSDLTWVFDIQFTRINVADRANNNTLDTSYDSYWREPAIGEIRFEGHTFNPADSEMINYRNEMRYHHDSEHAFIIFVTPYGSSWHAYSAGSSFIVLAEHGNNWGNWGQNSLDRIGIHEVCHKYGAADEYTGAGTPCSSCGGSHGCDNIPNGNCQSCADPGEPCIMHTNELRLCQYTKAQIGWSDIFVELTTSNANFAGTDDSVKLNIGTMTRLLNIPNYDDRERGHREGHALWFGGGLSRESIKHILLKKEEDGWSGGWKLKRIKVWHDGELICSKTPNKWIEDDDLMYLACTYDDDYVHSLEVRLKTADAWLAGTDDDVTFHIGSRSWNLDNQGNDRERNSTDNYLLYPRTGLKVEDISSFRIRKSKDGAFGGWKLKGVRIKVNGTIIYNNNSINQWLEDGNRTFSDDI